MPPSRVPVLSCPQMPQEYQTVFEISLKSLDWSGMLQPGIIAAIGFALFRFSKQRFLRIFGIAASIFGMIFVLISCLATVPAFLSVRHAFIHGQSSVIEGPVENFHPKPALGEAKESFTVQGVSFSYNVFENGGCFHDDPPIIHPGLGVRLYYNGVCIQRVDLIKPRAQPIRSL